MAVQGPCSSQNAVGRFEKPLELQCG
jgi:hypothetical protein